MTGFDDVPLNWRVIIPLTLHDDVKSHSFVGSLTSSLPTFAPPSSSGRAPGARWFQVRARALLAIARAD